MSLTPTGMSATFVYLDLGQKEQAKALAERDEITLSDVIRRALQAELRRHGRKGRK